jgi:hypothetical protein
LRDFLKELNSCNSGKTCWKKPFKEASLPGLLWQRDERKELR